MSRQKMNNTEEAAEEQEGKSFQEKRSAETVTVGKLLRQVREKKGLSTRDISLETNISSSNLVSIEHENYNELPSDTFIRGQLAIYADFLGLDGVEIARLFFEERDLRSTGKKKKRFGQHDNGLSAKLLAEPAHVSSATLAGGLLLLIITFIIVFCWYTAWNPFSFLLTQEQPSTSLINSTSATEEPVDFVIEPEINEIEAEKVPEEAAMPVPDPPPIPQEREDVGNGAVEQDIMH
jgi:cytoskeletal protein RodZ